MTATETGQHTDNTGTMARKLAEGQVGGELPTSAMPTEDSEVAARLNQAVRNAGGASAVARRAGVPLRTLNHYLGGLGLKVRTLVALADACGVSVEWLATGRPGIGHNQPPPPDVTIVHDPEKPDIKAFRDLDMDRLAIAVHETFARIRERRSNPDWRAIAQLIALHYDRADLPDSIELAESKLQPSGGGGKNVR